MSLKLKRYPKRGSNWYIRGTVRGQAVFETTGTDDPKAAEAIRIKREAQLLDRSVFGAGATVTFAEAAISYLEQGGEARYLGSFNEQTGKWSLLIGQFGSMPLAKIGQADIDKASRDICPTAGPATRKRHIYIPMCAVLNHAARKGWCPRPMIVHPRVKEPQTRWATPEYLARLLVQCAPPLRRLVVLMAYTGLRLSEALRIDWYRDVDLNQRTIVLRRTKTKMRTLHIPDPLLSELATVADAERHGPLFHWTNKSHVHRPLRTACRRAGLDYMSPHQLGRHTYATWLRIYGGLDLIGLKDAGGWQSIASVARYAHVVPGEAARAADLLPDVQNPCSPALLSAKSKRQKRKSA